MNKNIGGVSITDEKIKAVSEDCKSWRRLLHQYPQTSYEEEFSSNFITEKLKSFGLEVRQGMAKTGVVASLSGTNGNSNKKIILRADIDALNITEENDFDYKSKNPGKMHACGHDGHTAMLLAAAKYLSETRKFSGQVHFVFQPAEEGGAGADKMIKEGLFEKYPADSVWGMHNFPGIEVGTAGMLAGPMMASADEFKIVVNGKGGHAAMPHKTCDPILAGSHIVTALQSIIARNLPYYQSGVVTVSCFNAGSAFNIIPDKAIILGTFRAIETDVRDLLASKIQAIATGIGESFGARVDFKMLGANYPALVNSKHETEIARMVARQTMQIDENIMPSMGGEDFAFMLQKKPGCYIVIGNGLTGNKGGNGLHNAKYDFNDDAAIYGITYWINLVQTLLL